jgi:hypothetical protein
LALSNSGEDFDLTEALLPSGDPLLALSAQDENGLPLQHHFFMP